MEFDLDEATAILERTPRVLESWLSGLPDPWIRGNEGPDTWSPFNVVGHLIDGEEHDWMVRARIILDGSADRRFAPYDRFRHLRERQDVSLDDLLRQFAELRAANLVELRGLSLTRDHFELTGEHPTFGEVTLAQLLATWAAHDLSHIAQIARAMAKQYRDAIGPWKQFLSVMGS